MLSRAAHELYWLSRYLERGGQQCRLLANQFGAIHDRSVEDVDRTWRRVYATLGREPLGGGLLPSEGSEQVMLADAFTLTDDLTFETANRDSVISCFSMARENARRNRNHISNEMWTCLNVAYLEMCERSLVDIWDRGTREFFLRASSATQAFAGWTDRTLYRDDGWHFLQLGRYVERAFLTVATLEAQLRLYPTSDPDGGPDWESLLEICEARASYRRLHSIEYVPSRVLDFLAADPRLSHSVQHALHGVSHTLREFSVIGHAAPAREVRRKLDRTIRLLARDWPGRAPGDDEASLSILGRVRAGCLGLHERIESAFFDYPIGEAHRA